MQAIVSSPTSGHYGVQFYYLVEGMKRQDHSKASFYLPCATYEQACAVVAAYYKDK